MSFQFSHSYIQTKIINLTYALENHRALGATVLFLADVCAVGGVKQVPHNGVLQV